MFSFLSRMYQIKIIGGWLGLSPRPCWGRLYILYRYTVLEYCLSSSPCLWFRRYCPTVGMLNKLFLIIIIIIIIIIKALISPFLQKAESDTECQLIMQVNYARLNQWVFTSFLNLTTSLICLRKSGREFHAFGVATANARSPNFEFNVTDVVVQGRGRSKTVFY